MEWASYQVALVLLLTHELDAVRRHEWRIIPVLRSLPDHTGFVLFVVLHIPLFWLILLLSSDPDAGVRDWFQIALSAFCIAHAGLHKLYEKHPAYEFNNPLSRLLIWSCAIAGAIHLVLRALAA